MFLASVFCSRPPLHAWAYQRCYYGGDEYGDESTGGMEGEEVDKEDCDDYG